MEFHAGLRSLPGHGDDEYRSRVESVASSRRWALRNAELDCGAMPAVRGSPDGCPPGIHVERCPSCRRSKIRSRQLTMLLLALCPCARTRTQKGRAARLGF